MYDKYFWNYVNESGYRKEIMRERRSYNRFGLKKSIDRFHLLIMIKRAKELEEHLAFKLFLKKKFKFYCLGYY